MTTEAERAAQRQYKATARGKERGDLPGGNLRKRLDCMVSPTSKERLARLARHLGENKVWVIENLLYEAEKAVLLELNNDPEATEKYLAK